MDDGAASDFEATLVLATMTVSQLSDSDDAQQPATSAQNAGEPGAAAPTLVPENVSNHTKIWSELSGVYLSCEMFFQVTIGMVALHAFLCPTGLDVIVV